MIQLIKPWLTIIQLDLQFSSLTHWFNFQTSLPDEFFKPKRTKKRTPQKPRNRPHAGQSNSINLKHM